MRGSGQQQRRSRHSSLPRATASEWVCVCVCVCVRVVGLCGVCTLADCSACCPPAYSLAPHSFPSLSRPSHYPLPHSLLYNTNNSVKPLEEPDDRTKPGTNITRPPALSTAGSGALSSMMMPPASPLSTPAGGGGVGGALVPPSPKLVPVPTPRGGGPQPLQQQKGDDGPLSPVQVCVCVCLCWLWHYSTT